MSLEATAKAKPKPKKIGKKSLPKREAFEIGDAIIEAGTQHRVELPVARLPVGTWLSLPVEVVHGARPGPTVWISAAIHGDELNGVPIIRQILRDLKAKTLAGTVVAVPVVNVFGLVSESRYLPDRRDLNRSFPGSKRGSLAGQLAHLFMTEVVAKCDLGMDFHTGSGGRTNLPQIRCNLDDVRTKEAAQQFGTSTVLHSQLRDGSLRSAADDLGIRCLLYEAGEAHRLNKDAIQIGVDGTHRVLAHLGMIEAPPAQASEPILYVRKSKWIRAARSGFFEMVATLGDTVAPGDVLARIHSAIDNKHVNIKANMAGQVIGHQTTALVYRGDGVIHLTLPRGG